MWWKLTALGALLCLTLSLAGAERDREEQEYSELTLGKSGPLCTKQGRRCVANATCTDQRCHCPVGQRGQAEIECVDRRELLCYVAADPHVHAFGRASAAVALPCRFKATKFATDFLIEGRSRFSYCTFEIWATNQLLHGRYVIRSVHISVGLSSPSHGLHTTAEIFKTANLTYYDTNDTFIYQHAAKVVLRDNVWGTAAHNSLQGFGIHPIFDPVNNFAILDIPNCQTRIKYRAFDPRRNKHQKQLPGLTIMATKTAEIFEGYPQAVCGRPSDSTKLFKQRAEVQGLIDADTAVLYDILEQQAVQYDNEMAGECKRAFDVFASSTDKTADINACGFLLTRPNVGKCLEDRGSQPIDVFNACMASRQGDKPSCPVYQARAGDCDGLPDWEGAKAAEISC